MDSTTDRLLGHRRVLAWLGLILATTFLFFITVSWDISRSSFYLLGLLGLLLVYGLRLNLHSNPEEHWLLYVVLLLLAVAMISFWFNDTPHRGPYYISSHYAKLLWAVPIFIVVKNNRLITRWLWALYAVGAIIAGVVAISDVWPFEQSILFEPAVAALRAQGDTYPAPFAEISLCMFGIALIGYRQLNKAGLFGSVLLGTSLILGLTAVALSGVRSVWLAIPVLLLIFLYLDRLRLGRVIIYTCVALLVIGPVLAYQTTLVKNRIDTMAADVQLYLASEHPTNMERNTAVGLRLELWRAAWTMFVDKPVIGIGPGAFKTKTREMAKTGNWHPNIKQFSHAHNQYLNSLASLGGLGLTAWMLLLLVPGWVFFKRVRNAHGDTIDFALAGLMFVIAYAIFGLGSVSLELKNQMAFYGFTIAALFGAIRQRELS